MERFGKVSFRAKQDCTLFHHFSDEAWISSAADVVASLRFIHEDGEWGEARGFTAEPVSQLGHEAANERTRFQANDEKPVQRSHSFYDKLCFMLRVAPRNVACT